MCDNRATTYIECSVGRRSLDMTIISHKSAARSPLCGNNPRILVLRDKDKLSPALLHTGRWAATVDQGDCVILFARLSRARRGAVAHLATVFRVALNMFMAFVLSRIAITYFRHFSVYHLDRHGNRAVQKGGVRSYRRINALLCPSHSTISGQTTSWKCM